MLVQKLKSLQRIQQPQMLIEGLPEVANVMLTVGSVLRAFTCARALSDAEKCAQ